VHLGLKRLAAIVGLLVGMLVASSSANATEDPIAVTWPSVTAFNPTATSYTFHVEDPSGVGVLHAKWGVHYYVPSVPVPHSGDVTMTFPDDQTSTIKIYRCVSSDCVKVAESPTLNVKRDNNLGIVLDESIYGPSQPIAADVYVDPFLEPLTTQWRIVPYEDQEGEALASGDVVLTANWTTFHPPISSLPTGHYAIVVENEQDTEDFGHLTGYASTELRIDAETSLKFTRNKPLSFYPAKDGYQDQVELPVASPEYLNRARLTVVAADGSTVYSRSMGGWSPDDPVVFTGRETGHVIAPGTYRLVVTAMDYQDNVATATSPPITVFGGQLHKLTFRKTVKASKAVVDKYVGACSTLRKPATRGWKGSLAYLSQTRCRRPDDSVVATSNGLKVPVLKRPDVGSYGRLKLTMYGGAAKGARSAYINMGFFDAKHDEVYDMRTFRGNLGEHVLTTPGSSTVRRGTTSAFVYWQIGLTAGSRYDVKSFTLELQYVDLV